MLGSSLQVKDLLTRFFHILLILCSMISQYAAIILSHDPSYFSYRS